MTYVSSLVRALVELEADIELVVFGNRTNRRLFPPDVEFVEIPLPPQSRYWPFRIAWQQAILPAMLRARRVDVAHHPMDYGPVVKSVPTVITLHDLIDYFYAYDFPGHEADSRMRYSMLLKRLTCPRADKVIAVSEATKRDALRWLGVDERRIVVIPEAAAPKSSTKPTLDDLPSGVSPPYFFVVASTNAHKNIEGTVRAFELAVESHGLEHSLVVCGLAGKDHSECMKTIERSRALARIRVLGFVTGDELTALYTHADALLFLSLKEGFGLPILEALEAGTPVLTSDLPPMRDVAGPGGLLAPPLDAEAAAKAMARLAREEGLRKRLAKEGREWASRFSWHRTARETLEVYEQVVQERGAPWGSRA